MKHTSEIPSNNVENIAGAKRFSTRLTHCFQYESLKVNGERIQGLKYLTIKFFVKCHSNEKSVGHRK